MQTDKNTAKVDVSIVVPVYNVQQYLNRCLNSIIKQRFSSFEIVLVDDGSTDGSGKICDKFAKKYPIIKVIHKENGGLSSARLAGFKVAQGSYICFIDSDDYLKDNYISDLFDSIVKNNADMSICAYLYETDEKQRINLLPIQENCITNISADFVLPILCQNNYDKKMIPNFMWLRMISKDIITEDLFVSEREVYQEDLVFNLLISSRLSCISLINKPNYIYCHNGASLTEKYRKNAWEMRCNLFKIIKSYCEKYSVDSKHIIQIHRFNAITYTVRNAVKKKDYNEFCCELNKVRNSNLYKECFRLIKYIDKKSSLILVLIRIKAYRIIYNLYK